MPTSLIDQILEKQNRSAIKLQRIVRRFIVRSFVYKTITKRYEKIYDPKRMAYFYYDTMSDTTSWKKPKLLLNGDIKIVSPTYTKDTAALMIQRQLWRISCLRKIQKLYSQKITVIKDESTGSQYYYNSATGYTSWDLPLFMAGQLRGEEAKNKNLSQSLDGVEMNNLQENEEESDDDDSENSDIIIERRRLERKYPRSKAQLLVDDIEDNRDNTELSLSKLNTSHITTRIYDLTWLKSLDLSGNQLTYINTEIQYLTNLESLNFQSNKISEVPIELEELMELKYLNLSDNNISTLPGHIYKLDKIEVLNLSQNPLHAIPIEVGNLELLKIMHEWEVGIGRLQSLKNLNCSHCGISDWPPQLERLTLLLNLNLSHNNISTISDSLEDNSKLCHLDLSYNILENLPKVIYKLPLQTLYLNNNKLRDLPPLYVNGKESHHFSELQILDISHNNIPIIGPYLQLLISLTNANFSYNRIHTVHESISYCTALIQLNLSHNQLSTLPSTISHCINIEILDLSYNLFDTLPLSLNQLKNIKILQLSYNLLKSIVDIYFYSMTNIEVLHLNNNQLESLPFSLFDLPLLTNLNLSHNLLPSFSLNFQRLLPIIQLDLSYNNIPSIPPIISTLVNLKVLELEGNFLTDLPSTLSELPKLRRIGLTKNSFQTVPSILQSVPLLQHWDLSWTLIPSYFEVQKGQGIAIPGVINISYLQRCLRIAWTLLDDIISNNEHNKSNDINPKSIKKSTINTNKNKSSDFDIFRIQMEKKKVQSIRNSSALTWLDKLNQTFSAFCHNATIISQLEYQYPINTNDGTSSKSKKTKKVSNINNNNNNNNNNNTNATTNTTNNNNNNNNNSNNNNNNNNSNNNNNNNNKDRQQIQSAKEESIRFEFFCHKLSITQLSTLLIDSNKLSIIRKLLYLPEEMNGNNNNEDSSILEDIEPDDLDSQIFNESFEIAIGSKYQDTIEKFEQISNDLLFHVLTTATPTTTTSIPSLPLDHGGEEHIDNSPLLAHSTDASPKSFEMTPSLDGGSTPQSTTSSYLLPMKGLTRLSKLFSRNEPSESPPPSLEQQQQVAFIAARGYAGDEVSPATGRRQSHHDQGNNRSMSRQGSAASASVVMAGTVPGTGDKYNLDSSSSIASALKSFSHALGGGGGGSRLVVGSRSSSLVADEKTPTLHDNALSISHTLANLVPSLKEVNNEDKDDDDDYDDDDGNHQNGITMNELYTINSEELSLLPTESTIPSDPLKSQHHPSFGNSDSALYSIAFETYFGLGSALLLRAEELHTTIRKIERYTETKSKLNVAQRDGIDLIDLIIDINSGNPHIILTSDEKDWVSKVIEKLIPLSKTELAIFNAAKIIKKDKPSSKFVMSEIKTDDSKKVVLASSSPSEQSAIQSGERVTTTINGTTNVIADDKGNGTSGTSDEIPELSLEQIEAIEVRKQNMIAVIPVLLRLAKQLLVSACSYLESASELLRIRGWDPLTLPFRGEDSCVDPEAIGLKPIATRFFYIYGRALLRVGGYSLAKAEFLRSLKIGNRYRPAQIGLIKSFMMQGDYRQAKVILTSMIHHIYGPTKRLLAIDIMPKHPELGMLQMIIDNSNNSLDIAGYNSAEQNRSFLVHPDGRLLRDPVVAKDILFGISPKVKVQNHEMIRLKRIEDRSVSDAVTRYELLVQMRMEVSKAKEALQRHEKLMGDMAPLTYVTNTRTSVSPSTSIITQRISETETSSGQTTVFGTKSKKQDTVTSTSTATNAGGGASKQVSVKEAVKSVKAMSKSIAAMPTQNNQKSILSTLLRTKK